jgi:hypothetical protein
MSLKRLDTRIREASRSEIAAEVADINREFLRLLTHPSARGAPEVLGLDAPLVEGLCRLNPDELELIAAAPLLLVEFNPLPGCAEIRETPERRAQNAALGESWQVDLQAFANLLLTCIWQTSRRDSLLTALFVGIDREQCQTLAGLSFGQISQCSRQAADLLWVKLAGHPRFWADLIRLARNGSGSQQIASRMSVIQLSIAQQWRATSSANGPRYL